MGVNALDNSFFNIDYKPSAASLLSSAREMLDIYIDVVTLLRIVLTIPDFIDVFSNPSRHVSLSVSAVLSHVARSLICSWNSLALSVRSTAKDLWRLSRESWSSSRQSDKATRSRLPNAERRILRRDLMTSLLSEMATETPARAHLLGLFLATDEYGASV